MSHPPADRVPLYDSAGRWGEDFWIGLLTAGFLLLIAVFAFTAWNATPERTALLDGIQTTRPTLPTLPH